MGVVKITNLPPGPNGGRHRAVLADAKRRGLEILGSTGPSFHSTAILLIGMADIVAEMKGVGAEPMRRPDLDMPGG